MEKHQAWLLQWEKVNGKKADWELQEVNAALPTTRQGLRDGFVI